MQLTTLMDTFTTPPRILFHAPYPRSIKAFAFERFAGRVPVMKVTLDDERVIYVCVHTGKIMCEVAPELKKVLDVVFGAAPCPS
jgi:hypothetical protein